MNENIPQGLRPEGAELYFISLGLLPGNVEQKKAELTKKMQSEALVEVQALWKDGDRDKLLSRLVSLSETGQLPDEQIIAFLRKNGISNQQALEAYFGKEKCEDLSLDFS